MDLKSLDQRICSFLREFPNQPQYARRYEEEAHHDFLRKLFEFLCNSNDAYVPLLFPNGIPAANEPWSLSKAQGAVEGAEYTEAARGKPCGHILKSGEPSYRCKTCTDDETCVLCSRCFDASDHEGHHVTCSVSTGNAGCCDCGDAEAWVRPVHCRIHSPLPETTSHAEEKTAVGSQLPSELLQSMRITISRLLDYINDVISCSPEQLRNPKTEESVMANERESRLSAPPYIDGDGEATQEEPDTEFAVLVWNDEKHNIEDVQHHISRAAKLTLKKGMDLAKIISNTGRVAIKYDTDLAKLVKIAQQIEVSTVSITIRSARDTFREQICAAIISWLSDIAGCTVGSDTHILRSIICDELLQPWRKSSQAPRIDVGQEGLHDHELEEHSRALRLNRTMQLAFLRAQRANLLQQQAQADADENGEADGDGEDEVDVMEIEADVEIDEAMEHEIDMDDALETNEATLAGYSPPPPPPPAHFTDIWADQSPGPIAPEPLMRVPQLPTHRVKHPSRRPPSYWLEKPEGFARKNDLPAREDLWQRTRIDWLILFDLRMWKNIRSIMRDLFISTVVNIPDFKRLLGLRFAGLYTPLAQLYLIADREPDYSIISLSLQMLTTPSITAEVIDRGNFLTALIAILYTFVTTRQVSYAEDVNLSATLALEAGVAGNRRLHHFWHDMRCLLTSPLAQERIRTEGRYMLQFLDLVKLYQGIVPNKRVIDAHVEYESDEWVNAGQMVKEINRMVYEFSQAFSASSASEPDISRALRQAARAATINALGAERMRFDKAALKHEIQFKTLPPFEFDPQSPGFQSQDKSGYRVVDFEVAQSHMSFHHPLHHLLSWLVDCNKNLTPQRLHDLMSFDQGSLRDYANPATTLLPSLEASDYLLALFDIPLRQLAWLAQVRACLWVRNGVTVRHQALEYRSVRQRELTYQRDVFMMQVAFAICDPSSILASTLDRFGLVEWATSTQYPLPPATDEAQMVDVAEAFIHLLTTILCDRQLLETGVDKTETEIAIVRRELAHVLCFKPLSHSALSSLVTERVRESDYFEDQIEEMAHYNAPRALDDTGTFTLNEDFVGLIDPYITLYSHNQREEAESIWRKHNAKITGKSADDHVFEPTITPITSGAFVELDSFVKTPLFVQILYYFLQYFQTRDPQVSKVPAMKVEAFLQSVLHLILASIISEDASVSPIGRAGSFVSKALGAIDSRERTSPSPTRSLIPLLQVIAINDSYKSFRPKVRRILQMFQERQPELFASIASTTTLEPEDTAVVLTNDEEDARALKKKQALERAANAMAKMKEQQKSFMANQPIQWGDDDDSSSGEGMDTPIEDEEDLETRVPFPSGDCIHCKEPCGELDRDSRLYGMFSYFVQSKILRQTPQYDSDWTGEVFSVPTSLDRSADHLRPFGVAGQNVRRTERRQADGTTAVTENRVLGKGFPCDSALLGPVATGCGSHLMHFTCFEEYNKSIQQRQSAQTARHPPEKLALKEFLCPFCKALGNAFLPIIWKARSVKQRNKVGRDADLQFEDWLVSGLGPVLHRHSRADVPGALQLETEEIELQRQEAIYEEYAGRTFIPRLGGGLALFKESTHPFPTAQPEQYAPPGFGVPFGNLPAFVPVAPMRGASEEMTPPAELYRTYTRLRETMKANRLKTRFQYPAFDSRADSSDALTHTDVLSQTLAFSISALEIANRGVEAQHTLLDRINPSALMHLVVISETVQSYIVMGGLRNNGQTKTNREFVASQQQQMRQMFVGLEEVSGHDRNILTLDFKNLSPLLHEDPFIFLAEASIYLVPTLGIEPTHMLQLCYIAEVVRVILSCCSIEANNTGVTSCLSTPLQTFSIETVSMGASDFTSLRRFVEALLQRYHEASSAPPTPIWLKLEDSPDELAVFWGQLAAAIATYALPFLRKAMILMHVRFGMDFSNTTHLVDPAAPELQRLTSLLGLPTLPELFDLLLADAHHSHILQKMIDGWIKHWVWTQEGKHVAAATSKIARVPSFPFSLSHPGVFEIIGLPTKFATLADAAVQLRCPSTGLELTDPTLCLWCGEIFCGQATCCDDIDEPGKFGRVGPTGGCNRHRRKCGVTTGAFLHIRKCHVLLHRAEGGSFFPAPYLDKHGEADSGLRRHGQLYLNMRRADAGIRKVWLDGGIPSAVARKLDAENNTGGWDTL